MDISPNLKTVVRWFLSHRRPVSWLSHPYRPVFNNYTWSAGLLSYSHRKFNIIPSRIPVSALIAGMSSTKWLAVG